MIVIVPSVGSNILKFAKKSEVYVSFLDVGTTQ